MSEPLPSTGDEIVLCIHSTGTSPLLWAGIRGEVVRGLPVRTPANLGYAPNPPLARGTVVTLEAEAAALMPVVADAAHVHLVAHSYGGTVALQMAAEFGPRLRSMFLYEPVLFGALARASDDAAATAEARAFAAHPWFLTDDARGGTEPWLEIFIDYWNRPGAWARLPAPMRAHALASGWKMYQEVRACFADAHRYEDWRVDAPTTIAIGARSPAASRAMARGLVAAHPRARLVELPGVGHMAPLTQPAVVHAALRAHLAQLALPGA